MVRNLPSDSLLTAAKAGSPNTQRQNRMTYYTGRKHMARNVTTLPNTHLLRR
jgi:hypothetical protein